ncbi:unnamed protein product, partial [Brenthis ino]
MATAANLTETRQLRRRYYSAQVYAQTQVHSLFVSLSYSDGATIHHDQRDIRPRTEGLTCSPRHGGETPPTSQLQAAIEMFKTEKSITKLASTRNSNQRPPDNMQPS